MFIAKWSWRDQYKIFLIDVGDSWDDAREKALSVAGYGGKLEVDKVYFDSVPRGIDVGKTISGVSMIITSED